MLTEKARARLFPQPEFTLTRRTATSMSKTSASIPPVWRALNCAGLRRQTSLGPRQEGEIHAATSSCSSPFSDRTCVLFFHYRLAGAAFQSLFAARGCLLDVDWRANRWRVRRGSGLLRHDARYAGRDVQVRRFSSGHGLDTGWRGRCTDALALVGLRAARTPARNDLSNRSSTRSRPYALSRLVRRRDGLFTRRGCCRRRQRHRAGHSWQTAPG